MERSNFYDINQVASVDTETAASDPEDLDNITKKTGILDNRLSRKTKWPLAGKRNHLVLLWSEEKSILALEL